MGNYLTKAILGGVTMLSFVTFADGQTAASPRPTAPAAKTAPLTPAAQKALLDQYCVTCHNQKAKIGGLAIDKLDLAHIGDEAEAWEKVVRKLRAGMMPPQGMPRPTPASYEALTVSLETAIDKAASAKPNLVPPGVHRVNRTEYANAIHSMLGLDVDPSAYLPVDDASSGFDNVAGSLGISPALVEGYMSAAAKISRLALGHETGPTQKKIIIPEDRSQEGHVEGLPIGTRGGTLIKYYFPADGDYVISWFPVRGNTGELFGGNMKGEKLEVLIDGERVKLFDVDKVPKGTDNDKNEALVAVKAGLRNVGVTFLATTQVPIDDLNQHSIRSVIEPGPVVGFTFAPQLGQVIIMGPYNGKRPTDTLSRKTILTCKPATAAEELPCARTILSSLARKAFRRPVTDTDLEDLLGDYQEGRNDGDFENGIQRALQALLADPEFVYRAEADPANVKPGQSYRISDLELASRLAFFLWSSPPDDQLLSLATQGKLKNTAVLEQQTRRMLADPRSRSLVDNFAGQWLQLRNLASAAPITLVFPDFDDNLREAFKTETELLFESIVREDRNVVDLLNADFTFVNERLARHYGIPNIYGSQFRKVKLDGDLELRRGLLGQGSIELVTALADRTSPVQRGKWILMNVLGQIPPEPPPNVPPLKDSDKMANGVKVALEQSMRQRMEEHRVQPTCAACHKMMDPLGFGLEAFDAVGAYRTTEFGRKMDVTGQLTDGTKFDGPAGLRQALLKYSPQFVRTVTEKLMVYALGRGVEYEDMPVIRAIVHDADRNNDRFSSLILGIVKSAPFQMNAKTPESVASK